jgi:hypothetical protein
VKAKAVRRWTCTLCKQQSGSSANSAAWDAALEAIKQVQAAGEMSGPADSSPAALARFTEV